MFYTTNKLDIERGSDGESLLKSGRKLRKSRVTAPLFGFYGGECLRGFYGGGVGVIGGVRLIICDLYG